MARPRAAQFGRDIGVSTAGAKKLINEGRRRKDGGSATLESNMNRMRGYDVGGSVAKGGKKKSVKNIKDVDEMERSVTEDSKIGTDDQGFRSKSVDDRTGKPIMREAYPKEVEDYMKGEGKKKERKAAMGTYVEAKDGKYMSCRGMGAAVQGGKFSGTK